MKSHIVKIVNHRQGGSLFHYAHFIWDCLYNEINNIHLNRSVDEEHYIPSTVIRKKNIDQTLGNFAKIYEDVMGVTNREVSEEEFDAMSPDIPTILTYRVSEPNKYSIDYVRNFIFRRYGISDSDVFDSNYPEVLLIQRGERIPLIDDTELQCKNTNITMGKERREIRQIRELKAYLEDLFDHRNTYKAVFLEKMSFQEQIKHFNNAKLIICAHGAALANMLFCKRGTSIVEVVCDHSVWPVFDRISSVLELNHLKCRNDLDEIKRMELNGLV